MPGTSTVAIEELSGLKRQLNLYGAGLPLRGADFPAANRATKSNYPGNSYQATIHVLGSYELDPEWEGVWRTNRLVSSPALFIDGAGASPVKVSRASTLRDVFEDIIRSGSPLRITWSEGQPSSGELRKIVREAVAAEWHFPHERMDDIAWRVSWLFSGRGTKQKRAVALRKDNEAQSLKKANRMLSELTSQITGASIVSSKQGIPLSANTFSLGDLEQLADLPNALMDQVRQFTNLVMNRVGKVVGLLKAGATSPASIASEVIDLCTSVVNQSNQFVDEITRQIPDAYTNVPARASMLARAMSYYSDAITQAELISATMREIERSLRRRRNGLTTTGNDRAGDSDILAVHIAKQGETFLSIAQLYYERAELSWMVAKANNYPGYQVEPEVGAVLIIPVLTFSQTGQKV